MSVHLHGFFRSSASWRVRIALALKGVGYDQTAYKLRAGEQRSPGFLKLNPQGLVGVAIEWDRLAAIEANCLAHEAFDSTAPDKQPDFSA